MDTLEEAIDLGGPVDACHGLLARGLVSCLTLPRMRRPARGPRASLVRVAALGGRGACSLALRWLGGGCRRRALERAPIRDERVARRTVVVFRPRTGRRTIARHRLLSPRRGARRPLTSNVPPLGRMESCSERL